MQWTISNDQGWPILINKVGYISFYPKITHVGKAVVRVKTLDNSWNTTTNFVESNISFELNIIHINYNPVCSSAAPKQSENNFVQGSTKETIAC